MTDNTAGNKETRKIFVESIYENLRDIVSPTPLLKIEEAEDDGGHTQLDLEYLDGKGVLPSENTTEITVLDIGVASLFYDDIHPLYEGETGTGKTFTTENLFKTLFGEEGEGQYQLRLSNGPMGNSALDPYSETKMENGIPQRKLDEGSVEQYAGLFVDEINRGDPQEVFQIVDGKIHIGDQTAELGLPIKGTDRRKGLAIIAAMNPADAKHKDAQELDIAGENRFLKFDYPNGAEEAATSQMDKKDSQDLHEKFWNRIRDETGLEGSWRELYPQITDSENLEADLTGEAKEFIDAALGFVGKDPKQTYEDNLRYIEAADLHPRFRVVEGNELDKIKEYQDQMKHGLVRRDLDKVQKMSQLLGFIKGVKEETYDTEVGMNDIAASMGVVLESKKRTDEDEGDLMNLVNDAKNAYNDILEDVGEEHAIPGYGLRQTVLRKSLKQGQEHGIEGYMGTLTNYVGSDIVNTSARSVAEATIRSRILADLSVLKDFSERHEEEIEQALEAENTEEEFQRIYEENKGKASPYDTRLNTVINYRKSER